MQLTTLLQQIKNGTDKKSQFLRFVLNGCIASGIHYGIYTFLLFLLDTYYIYVEQTINRSSATSLAYAIGYIVSFVFNFYFTCHFTFRATPTMKLFFGFSGSHVVNFFLQMLLFAVCIHIGIHRLLAPIVVMGIAMLVQFTILRFVFKR